MKKQKTSGTLIIKDRTNGGDRCKMRIVVTGNSKKDVALIMHKLTLSSDPFYATFSVPLKTYKGKTLWFSITAIRLSTLYPILDWMNTLEINKNFK